MKTHLNSFLQAFLTVFLTSYGAVFCMVSAYGFTPGTIHIVSWILVLSAVFGFCAVLRHRNAAALLVCAGLLTAGWYFRKEITGGALAAADVMVGDLINAYPAFEDLRISAEAADTTAAFMAYSCIPAMLSYLAMETSFFLPLHIIFCTLSAMACLLETDKVPDCVPLCCLLAGMIYPPLTFRERAEKGEASWLGAAFLSLCVLIPFIFVHPSEYVRMEWADSFTERLRIFAEEHAIFHHDAGTGDIQVMSPIRKDTAGSESWNTEISNVSLSSLGPRTDSQSEDLQVYTETSGKIYLRGVSYAVYEDNSWKQMPESSWTLGKTDVSWTEYGGVRSLTVRTPSHVSVMYTPYGLSSVPENGWPVRDSYIRNTNASPQYTLQYSSTNVLPMSSYTYWAFAMQNYLQVPEGTREALEDTARGLHTAEDIRDYVSRSASYDLDTGRMPAGRDFVTWFLEESDTGYCVHFASAAVILLRLKGIPARYVTGYTFNAESGVWNSVKRNHAHAWVEYYSEGEGWKVMDPTPSAYMNAEYGTVPAETETPDIPEEDPAVRPEVQVPETSVPETVTPVTKPDFRFLYSIGRFLLMILLCVLAFILQRFLRRKYTEYGSYNDRVRKLYRHMGRMSFLCRVPVNERAGELAREAAFSNRVFETADLEEMETLYGQLCEECGNKDILRKILVRIIRI